MNIGHKKVWIITDMHLNHDNMVKFCDRPVNFTELIQKNWKKKVGKDDIVIDLGDVIFRNSGELRGIMANLPGTKYLVQGNHDRKTYSWFLDQGYDWVGDTFTWDPIHFSHKPAKYLPEGCEWNIHGHLHLTPYDNPYDPFVQEPWHILMTLEKENYGPVLLDDFLKKNGVKNGINI